MDATVAVTGAHAAEDLRQLRAWLAQEPELRGNIQLIERPPGRDHLGGTPEILSFALGGGTGASVLASAIVAWLRYRTSDVVCTVTKSNGSSVRVSAERVRDSGMAAQQRLVRELAATLDESANPNSPAHSGDAANSGDAATLEDATTPDDTATFGDSVATESENPRSEK